MNYPKNQETALKWTYKFWDTQPMMKFKEIVTRDGIINPDQNIEELSKEQPLPPENFMWENLDINNQDQLKKVSSFLDKFFMIDSSNNFKCNYSPELLEWLYKNSEYIGLSLTVKKTGLVVGFIIGKVINMQVNRNKLNLVETNFLCVHPKLRTKNMVPMLINELKRQFNLKNYFNGLFVDIEYLPTPISTIKRFNRAINIDNLIETEYMKLDQSVTVDEVKKALRLPDKKSTSLKKMEKKHLEQVYELFNEYMEKYNFHPIFTLDEFKHMFLNNKFVTSYVYEDTDGYVLDFVSYYNTESTVFKTNKIIKKGTLFYYTCLNETQYKLIQDILIVAKNNGIDVFNAMEIMENQYTLKELGFEENSANLHYYLYNWRTRPFKQIQMCYLSFF